MPETLVQGDTITNSFPATMNMPESIADKIEAPPQPMGAQDGSQSKALDDSEIREVSKIAGENLQRMLYYRRQYDPRFAMLYRQYIGQREQRKFPDNVVNRSNTFLGYPYSNVETVVSRVLDAFFSQDEWFQTNPGSLDTSSDDSDHMQAVLMNRLNRAGVRQAIEYLVRTICIYGTGGIKVDWDWDYEVAHYREMLPLTGEDGMPLRNPQSGQAITIPSKKVKSKAIPRMRPKFIPIDIFDLMIDPDKKMVVHMVERTWGQMKREYKANPNLYWESGIDRIDRRLSGEQDADAVLIRMAELWDSTDNTVTVMTFGDDKDTLKWKDTRAAYRSASYTPWKLKMLAGDPIMLYHGENPFLHRRNPVLFTNYVKLTNDVYGLGMLEPISSPVESLNKFVNMIVDNWNLGINRRYVYNTDVDIDHNALDRLNVPGGKVGVAGEPEKAIFPLPSFTPQAGDYQIIDLYRGIIEMTSGISDFYQKGIGSPTGNRTSTGISQVIQESNFKFRMFIWNLIVDIVEPMLEMCASMVQQYMPDQWESLITGEQPLISKYPNVSPEELVGTFEFKFAAANYVTNDVVRQRNLLAFANIVKDSPYLDQYQGLRELAKAFKIPNVDKILKTPDQVQQEQQQAQQKQMQMLQAQNQAETSRKVTEINARESAKMQADAAKMGRPPVFGVENAPSQGAGIESPTRDFAQNMGQNAIESGLQIPAGGGL